MTRGRLDRYLNRAIHTRTLRLAAWTCGVGGAQVPGPALFTVRTHNVLLTGVCCRPDISLPYFAMDEFEQRSHVGEAGGDYSDGGLDTCPHARVHLGVWIVKVVKWLICILRSRNLSFLLASLYFNATLGENKKRIPPTGNIIARLGEIDERDQANNVKNQCSEVCG